MQRAVVGRTVGLAAGLLFAVVIADYCVAWSANAGLPFVFARVGEGKALQLYWLGFLMRGLAYAGLALLVVGASRIAGLPSTAWRRIAYTVAATLTSGLFWFVVDASAFPNTFPGVSATLGRTMPFFARIYQGWGYVEYFWWLAVVHWAICCGLLIILLRWPRFRGDAGRP